MSAPLGKLNARPDDTETHSSCLDCKQFKPFNEFGKASRNANGLQEFCAECKRWRDMWFRYGLTKDEWLAMFDAQGGLCGLCGDELAYRRPGHKVVTDHCHDSSIVRGILCPRCNVGLGFTDSVGMPLIQQYIDRSVRARESNSG